MGRECIVFPTSRCIRHALDASEELILPHYMTMGEFLGRASIAKNRIIPDEDLRLLALHEASDFSAFASLNIERNFFTFIQNAQYLFRFFEELSSERVHVETLAEVDVYGEYEEHIAILTHLQSRYRDVCERNGWADPIFAAEIYTINTEFLRNYDSVHIEVEGYLSRREMEILGECARVVPLRIAYNATFYNRKMTRRFAEMGFELEEGRGYTLCLSGGGILSSHPLRRNRELECEIFHNRLAQIGFIKAKIEAFVDAGIAPEKIAVILPDESFSDMVAEFDEEENFNFAMGTSFAANPLFCDIENVQLFLDEGNVLNTARVRRISSDTIGWLREHNPMPFRFGDLEAFLERFGDKRYGDDALNVVREEMQTFRHLSYALETMDFKSVLRIFMNRLRGCTIDDVRGGKITVMGVLETRGIAFEGVIVVDFNEGFVPHKSEKDLFLNTQTRQFAALPTTHDRESLQKHYYAMLFDRAEKVAIGCVQNAESVPSRFLLQLGISAKEAQYRYERVLFAPAHILSRRSERPSGEYDFAAHPLSASSLKSFLTCRRQFYYRYILHLAPHELPRDLSQERDIGNALHAALETIYRERDHYSSPGQIKTALQNVWEAHKSNDPLERHMRGLWMEKLEPFYAHEAARFAQGWRVLYREKEASAEVEGIKLVGRIDRIDVRSDVIEVIDYKSGKYPDVDKEPQEGESDFQLSVYALLCAPLGEVGACGYYDLGRGELKKEQYPEAKNAQLKEILRSMASQKVWEWEMCEEVSRCRYCHYVYLCNREAMRGV